MNILLMARTPSLRYAASKALLGGPHRLFLFHTPSLATLSLQLPQLHFAIFEALPPDPHFAQLCHYLRVVNNPSVRLVAITDDRSLAAQCLDGGQADVVIATSDLAQLPRLIEHTPQPVRPPRPLRPAAHIRETAIAATPAAATPASPRIPRMA